MNAQYGLDPTEFLVRVVRPTLLRISLDTPPAQVLVLGTALTESHLRHLDQVHAADKLGPALGVYQMEAPTHEDIWRNFLTRQIALRLSVARLSIYISGDFPDPGEMVWNLAYATAMCRVHYRRDRVPLPAADDAHGMAQYWKRCYNTSRGKGRIEDAEEHFEFAAHLCAGDLHA